MDPGLRQRRSGPTRRGGGRADRPAGPVRLAPGHARDRAQGTPPPRRAAALHDADGHRLTAFATNTRAGRPGTQLPDLELRHRRRARAEDRIRCAKDTGLTNLPLHDFAQPSPSESSRPMRRSWPNCCWPNATTATPAAKPAASPMRASPAPNGSPTWTPTPIPTSTRHPRSARHRQLGRAGQPLCLIGDSGTGKTHLLIALGTAAAEAGYRVRYVLGLAPSQRTRRSRRRTAADQGHRPLRPGRPALPRRARLPRAGPPRRGAAVPSPHRTRGTQRHRQQRAVQRLDQDLYRPAALHRHRRPTHFNGHILQTGTSSYRLARTQAGQPT